MKKPIWTSSAVTAPSGGRSGRDLDEYPLLNEPNVMLVALRTTLSGPASPQDCLDHLEASLRQAGLSLPPEIKPLRRRIESSYHCLEAARLVERQPDGRFSVTPRGRETLRAHPTGIDTSVLVEFPEFRVFIQRSIGDKDENIPHPEPPKEYSDGYIARLSGGSISDNPYSSDTIAHLEWENGWCAAQDEKLDTIAVDSRGSRAAMARTSDNSAC